MDQYSNRTYIFFVFLLLILIITFSCKKKEDINRHSDELSNSITETSTNGTLVFGSSKPKNIIDSSKDKMTLAVIDAMDIKGQLFSINSMDIIPEDMDIGPLLDFNMQDSSETSFRTAVINFFMDAEKGILNKESLHPSYLETIKKLFSDELEKQSYTLRIGRIVDDNDIDSANIRLVSNTGRVSGTVSADNLDGKWLISDISVNMKQLKKEYLRKSEFNPLSYSNILLNY